MTFASNSVCSWSWSNTAPINQRAFGSLCVPGITSKEQTGLLCRAVRMMPEAGFGLSINSWDDKYFVVRSSYSPSMQGSLSPLSHFDPSCHCLESGERRAESGEQTSRESSRCFETGLKTSLAPVAPPPAINPERCQCRCHCSVGGGGGSASSLNVLPLAS
jgi:hypothetical protein